MSTSPDETMNAAMAAFGALEDQPQPPADPNEDPRDEENDGQDENPLDSDSTPDDDSREDGDEPTEDEQEEEPETPAIDPPARLSAEKKKAFAALPPAAQQFIAAEMGEQERAIGLKAQEAAAARKHAEAVTEYTTNVHRQFAEQLDTYAQAITPQRPSYELLATDPQAYAYHMAQFESASAQLNELQQRAAQARQAANEAEDVAHKTRVAETVVAIREAIPEMATTEGFNRLWPAFKETAAYLGYPDARVDALDVEDMLALQKATSDRVDAQKWRALQAGKMESVRAAKAQPKVSKPGTAQPKGTARAQGLQDSMTQLRKSGDVRDAARAFSRLG